MNEVHFSSRSNEWLTPDFVYHYWDKRFGPFGLDAAASKDNAKCSNFLTQEQNALIVDWTKISNRIWLNPPYGRLIGKFIKKAYEESLNGAIVVCLIPARTDTKWWHEYCANGMVYFIKGRLKFVNKSFPSFREDGNFKLSPAPFPSAIVIFGVGKGTEYLSSHE